MYYITVENAAPKNFRNISSTCTAITFQWDPLLQRDNMTSWYVITCSSLKEASVATVSIVQ